VKLVDHFSRIERDPFVFIPVQDEQCVVHGMRLRSLGGGRGGGGGACRRRWLEVPHLFGVFDEGY
jgi:hypothetical protein